MLEHQTIPPQRSRRGSYSTENLSAKSRGFFPSKDGTAIYYETYGRGAPLVLCYGLTCQTEHWAHQVGHFSRHYQVVLFDYRGHHRSAAPANDKNLTIEWCATDLIELIQYLNLKQPVCFGHSMGVPVIIDALVKAPKKINAAVLICGGVSDPFGHMFHSDRAQALFKSGSFIYKVFPEAFSWFWKKLTADNHFAFWVISRFGFNISHSDPRIMKLYLEGVNRTPMKIFHPLLCDYARLDYREKLRLIEHPILVVAGAEDFITPLSIKKDMASTFPNARLEIIRYGSHNAHVDYADEVNEKIGRFLKTIDNTKEFAPKKRHHKDWDQSA